MILAATLSLTMMAAAGEKCQTRGLVKTRSRNVGGSLELAGEKKVGSLRLEMRRSEIVEIRLLT